jgi:hypothetical protein
MKTIRHALTFLLAVAALPAFGQVTYNYTLPRSSSSIAHAIAEDGDTGLVCKYIGTSACAAVAVASDGNLTFTDGACGAEAATDTFECPVSGGLGGVIDVSDSDCDTVGELVDIVNAASDWRCLPYESLRADSSNDTLVTISATQATGPSGLALKIDSSVALTQTIAVAPTSNATWQFLSLGPQSTSFKSNPWLNSQALLTGTQSLTTYGSGTSLVSVVGVLRNQAAAGSETSITVWPSMVNGATTVRKVFGTCDTPATGCETAWGPSGLVCPLGYQCLVRVTNSAALSVNTLGINGVWASSPLLGGTQ